MPFNVELRAGVERDSPKIRAIHGGVVLPFDVIEERRQEFPLLRGIDPYSNTYFAQIQMRDLWMELAELAQGYEGDVRDTLEALIDMAQRGSEEPHCYMVFIGD
jgi:hypothetical protein